MGQRGYIDQNNHTYRLQYQRPSVFRHSYKTNPYFASYPYISHYLLAFFVCWHLSTVRKATSPGLTGDSAPTHEKNRLKALSTLDLLCLADSRHMGARKAALANVVDSSLAGSSKTELGVDALDTVSRVDVLDKGNLPAGSTTLAGSDGRGSEEVLPDLNGY